MFPSQIRLIAKLFDICGFNTQLSNLSNGQNSSRFINSMHIATVTSFLIFKFNFFHTFIHSLGVVEAISEYVEYSMSLNAYWIIVLDAIQHRQQQKIFWQSFQKSAEHFNYQSYKMYIIFFYEFYSVKLISLLSTIISLLLDQTSNFTFITYVIYIIPVKLCQLRIFYYIFCLKAIYLQLKSTENDLKQLKNKLKFVNNQNNSHGGSSYYRDVNRLKMIGRHFCNVCEMINRLNEMFGWSQVAVVLFCFYAHFSDLNYVYIHFRQLETISLIGNLTFFSNKSILCTSAIYF